METLASVQSYRDLVAWQKAMELAAAIYKLTSHLPEAERFGLIGQMRRAAVSVPSALAEGHSRISTKEFMRYISIAMGSLAEIETQLILCLKLNLLDEMRVQPLLESCDEQNRILRGLRKSLAARLPMPTRPSPLVSRP